MTYRLVGVLTSTGKTITARIRANSPESALRIAQQRGVTVPPGTLPVLVEDEPKSSPTPSIDTSMARRAGDPAVTPSSPRTMVERPGRHGDLPKPGVPTAKIRSAHEAKPQVGDSLGKNRTLFHQRKLLSALSIAGAVVLLAALLIVVRWSRSKGEPATPDLRSSLDIDVHASSPLPEAPALPKSQGRTKRAPISVSKPSKAVIANQGEGVVTEKRLAEQMARMPAPNVKGQWSIHDGLLTVNGKAKTRPFVEFGDQKWSDYIFICEMRVEDQPGCASIRVRSTDDSRWVFDSCAWGDKDNLDLLAEVKGENTLKSGSRREMQKALQFELGSWHHVEIKVRGTEVTVSLDGKEYAASEHKLILNGRVGVSIYGAGVVHWRGFEVRTLEGRILWQGLPALTGISGEPSKEPMDGSLDPGAEIAEAPKVPPAPARGDHGAQKDAVMVWPTTGPLTPAEVAIFRSGGLMHVLNKEPADGVPLSDWTQVLQLGALPTDSSPLTELARLVIACRTLSDRKHFDSQEYREHVKTFPVVYFETALRGLFAGLSGDDITIFDEFRKGPGRFAEAWIFKGRRQQIASCISSAETNEAFSALAAAASRYCESRMGTADLKSAFKLDAILVMRAQVTADMKRLEHTPASSNGVQIKYSGAMPITNVMVFVNVKTTGRRVALSEGQQEILRFNGAFGYDNHNPEVVVLLKAQNLLGSMPLSGYAYLQTMKPGDVLQVQLPSDTDRDEYLETTVSLFSDSGRLHETSIYKKKPQKMPPKKDPAREAQKAKKLESLGVSLKKEIDRRSRILQQLSTKQTPSKLKANRNELVSADKRIAKLREEIEKLNKI